MLKNIITMVPNAKAEHCMKETINYSTWTMNNIKDIKMLLQELQAHATLIINI